MPFPSTSITFGGRRPASSGTSTRGFTNHDPCALGRRAPVLSPLRLVRALPRAEPAQPAQSRRLERSDGLARNRRAGLRRRGAAVHRPDGGASDQGVRAAAYGEWTACAGSVPVTASLDEAALAELLRRPALGRLLAVLDGAGEEARIVGGAVRNALLGRSVHEIDIATTATPDTTEARARAAGLKTAPTGIEHGTVTVIVDGAPFEVTTLREDVETDGRRAVVRFGRDFAADARRRDFTLNALSLGRDGRLHDPVGGLADLTARRGGLLRHPPPPPPEGFFCLLRFFFFFPPPDRNHPRRAGVLG